MKKIIPQKEIVNCDVCNTECSDQNRLQKGKLTVNQAALDWNNMPCADGSISFDLCDCCLGHLIKTLNEEIEHIRNITDEANAV